MKDSTFYSNFGDILSVRDVGALLGCSRQYVYTLIEAGSIRALRIGKGFKIPKSSVIAFIEKAQAS